MYSRLSDKQQFFQEERIDSLDVLKKRLQELSSDDSCRFRGINEAKYKIISSLQRLHPNNQDEFIATLVAAVKANPQVRQFFEHNHILINDISVLALMQHYGLPTPFIDFTTSVECAAAFAADKMAFNTGEWETDNYVSMYFFSLKEEYEVRFTLQWVLARGMSSGKEHASEILKTYKSDEVDFSVIEEIDKYAIWAGLSSMEMCFIEYQPLAHPVVTLKSEELVIENPNLVNQNGCFILNYYSESMPLEENWYNRTIEARNYFWATRLSETDTFPYSGIVTRNKMHCLDVRKDIIKAWSDEHVIELYDSSDSSKGIEVVLKSIYENLK